jgi:hypothetical protein
MLYVHLVYGICYNQNAWNGNIKFLKYFIVLKPVKSQLPKAATVQNMVVIHGQQYTHNASTILWSWNPLQFNGHQCDWTQA